MEHVLLLGLLATPLLGSLLVAWLWSLGRTDSGRWILATTSLTIALLAISVMWQWERPIRWENPVAPLMLDPLGAAFVTALGLGLCLVGAAARSGLTPLHSVGLQLMLSGVVGFWLSESLWLALGLQTAVLGLAFVLIGWPAESTSAGAAGRQLWLTTICPDLALVLVAAGLTLEVEELTFRGVAAEATVVQQAAQSAALVTSWGTLLWLGSLGRLLQFPFGWFCDQSRHLGGPLQGAIGSLILAPIGWRWLATGQAWFLASPQTSQLVSGGSALGGGIAVWFALCSTDLRVRWAWFVAAQWSFAAAALLVGGAPGLWLSALLIITGMLAAAAVCALWDAQVVAERLPSDAEESAAPNVSWTSWRSGSLNSGAWFQQAQGTFRVWMSDAPPVGAESRHADQSSMVALPTIRGGRAIVWACGLALLAGPLLLMGTPPSPPDRLLTLEVTTDSVDADATAEALDPNRAAAWPNGLRILTLGLAACALTLLAAQVLPGEQGLSATEAVLVIAILAMPWSLAWLSPARSLLSTASWSEATCVTAAAFVLAGLGLGLLLGSGRVRLDERTPIVGTLLRLGRRRLYVPQILLFTVNLPTRGLAQLTRFLDWFLLDTVVLGTLRRLPRLGADADVELHRTAGGFYALSLCLSAAAVVLTLMWLGQ